MPRAMPDLTAFGIALPAGRKRSMQPRTRSTQAPTKRRAAPERVLQAAIVKRLKAALAAGSVVQAVRNEEQPRSKDPGERMNFFAKKKAQGHNKGFPDLGVFCPGGWAGFLELKADTVVSDAQDGMHTHLRTLGFPVAVVRSADEAVAVLRGMGAPLRERA